MIRANRRNRSAPRVEGLEGRTLLATNLMAGLPAAQGRIALRGLHAEIQTISPRAFEVHGTVQVVEVDPGLYQFLAQGTTPKTRLTRDKSFGDPLGNRTRHPAGLVGTKVSLGNAELILGGSDGDYLATDPKAETIVKVDNGVTTTTYDFVGDQVRVTKRADPAPSFKALA